MGRSGDPRKVSGGGIRGGSPWGIGDARIDATRAVLMEGVTVAMVQPFRGGEPALPVIAMAVEGRVNKSKDRTTITYLFDEDGAASLITELSALLTRAGQGDKLQALIEVRLRRLLEEGLL